MQAYVDTLDQDHPPTTPEEWRTMIEIVKDSILLSDQFIDQMVELEKRVDKLKEIEGDVEKLQRNEDLIEHRLQQFEDRGQRAMDFIMAYGLYEQFRRYYHKKKQTNIISFPQQT